MGIAVTTSPDMREARRETEKTPTTGGCPSCGAEKLSKVRMKLPGFIDRSEFETCAACAWSSDPQPAAA